MAFIREMPYLDEVQAAKEYETAVENRLDQWVVGGLATEVPCLRQGRWQLRVFNPGLRQHGWLDYDTDIVDVDPEPTLLSRVH